MFRQTSRMSILAFIGHNCRIPDHKGLPLRLALRLVVFGMILQFNQVFNLGVAVKY